MEYRQLPHGLPQEKFSVLGIGMGGIQNGADALEFILAGASAVAVGTANFHNPRATLDTVEGIRNYMVRHGIEDVKELVGSVEG